MAISGQRAMIERFGDREAPSAVRVWLFAVAALVFAMVVLGGVTRLTDSGLSITEWKPVVGVLPPMSDADWQDEFGKYRRTHEYATVNRGMSLQDFKVIYWWEWTHRFLGRLVGVAFIVPFALFVWRRQIPRALAGKLAGLFALGGLQGAIGWYMVQSGLATRVDVSQYRLALHLGVAVLILGLLLWTALGLGERTRLLHARAAARHRTAAAALVGLVFLQIILGAFVAGLRAGLSHNTWPLMDGALIPAGLDAMRPWYLNLFENVLTVQFNHRLAAYVLAVAALAHVASLIRSSAAPSIRLSAIVLGAAVLGQVALGVWTLLAHVPLPLGLAHQTGAIVVLALSVWHLHRAWRT